MNRIITSYILTVALVLFANIAQSQSVSQTIFGKNRVQFHSKFDEWTQYESENFITYWYGESRMTGQSAAQMAEADYSEIERTLEYRMSDKIEILVYSDLTDLLQSNIGSEDAFTNSDKSVKVAGNKIFVYFDGDHQHLRKQVREGVAAALLNSMLYGSNLQEVVQNAVLLNLPEWFKDGLVSYISDNWNANIDDQMRDIFTKNKYKTFNKFAIDKPNLAGHAFWYYISSQFGKSNVANILYLTRINRNMEEGLIYVLGSGYEPTALACMEYYKNRYQSELKDAVKVGALTSLKIANKRKLPLEQVRISPDGKHIAYITNEIGRYKVFLQDAQGTKPRELIFKGGTRNPFQATDYNYPILAWNPDNQRIAIVYERRDVVKLLDYDLKTKKSTVEDFSPQFQRVYSADYTNPKEMVISAAMGGFSDIFLYNTANRNFRRITQDYWDDLDAVSVRIRGHKGILFASNRVNDTLKPERLDSVIPINKFDIFYKDLEDTSKVLLRVTHTREVNERNPMAIDSTYFSFLTEESGVVNRQIAYLVEELDHTNKVIYYNKGRDSIVVLKDSVVKGLDSLKIDSVLLRDIYKTVAIVRNNTNYDRNIVTQASAPRVGKLVQKFYKDGIPKVSIENIMPDSVITPSFTKSWEIQQKAKRKVTRNAVPSAKDNTVPSAKDTVGTLGRDSKIIELVQAQNVPVAPPAPKDTNKVDVDNYMFQSEFDTKETPKTTQVAVDSAKNRPIIIRNSIPNKDKEITEPVVVKATPIPIPIKSTDSTLLTQPFKQSRITGYRLKFRSDYYTSKLDNTLLFGGLDTYAGTPQSGYAPPPMGILLKANFKDLLEDYQLEGGIRIPLTFNGAEYFAFFDDKKSRLDKRWALYHKTILTTDNGSNPTNLSKIRSTTSLAQYQLSYPFDIFSRLQGTATVRFDKDTRLSTDKSSLEVPPVSTQRIGYRLEYVFDNTLDVDANIKNGTRYKVFIDMMKRFEFNFDDKPKFNFDAGFMGVVGFDARHYERVLYHSVLALRAAGAVSFGAEQTLFYLGGADGELFNTYNNNITTPPGNYAFETMAANMRGFQRNIRNGTSYALVNAELRVPIFKYFSSKPLTSSFLRNFELVGFVDAGTAWHGSSPFNSNNPLNTITLPQDPQPNFPVTITVNYFKDPIVVGYGGGVRMMLFGYFIRGDYAWGIETRVVQKPTFHLSLGFDF